MMYGLSYFGCVFCEKKSRHEILWFFPRPGLACWKQNRKINLAFSCCFRGSNALACPCIQAWYCFLWSLVFDMITWETSFWPFAFRTNRERPKRRFRRHAIKTGDQTKQNQNWKTWSGAVWSQRKNGILLCLCQQCYSRTRYSRHGDNTSFLPLVKWMIKNMRNSFQLTVTLFRLFPAVFRLPSRLSCPAFLFLGWLGIPPVFCFFLAAATKKRKWWTETDISAAGGGATARLSSSYRKQKGLMHFEARSQHLVMCCTGQLLLRVFSVPVYSLYCGKLVIF